MLHKATFLYMGRSMAKAALGLYATLFGVLILMGYSYIRFISNAHGGSATMSFGGLGAASAIFLLVMGTVVVNEALPLLLACGVSRKTQFRAMLFAMLSLICAMVVFELIASQLIRLVMPYESLVMQAEILSRGSPASLAYQGRILAVDIATGFVWSIALYSFTFSIGFFMASLFKFIPRGRKIFGIIGFVVTILWFLPNLNTWTNNGVSEFLAILYGLSTLRHALFFAGFGALLLAIGYQFFSRMQTKAHQNN